MNSLAQLAARGRQRHVTDTTALTSLKCYAVEILADNTTFSTLTETNVLDSTDTVNRLTDTQGLASVDLPKGHIVYPKTGYYFTAITLTDGSAAYYEEV